MLICWSKGAWCGPVSQVVALAIGKIRVTLAIVLFSDEHEEKMKPTCVVNCGGITVRNVDVADEKNWRGQPGNQAVFRIAL